MSNNDQALSEDARFWIESRDRDHSTPVSESHLDNVSDDVSAAVKDARQKADDSHDIESSREHLESLRRGFGSIKSALEQNLAFARGYRTDPVTTREWHKRTYYGRMPDVAPAKEPDEKPPEDLTPEGRDEWERVQAVKKAIRSVKHDDAYAAELEEARPLFEQIKKEYGPIRTSLEQAAAVHEAMNTNPEVATRLSFAAGAPATEWQAAEQRHTAQRITGLNEWFGQVVASGALPGIERRDVQYAVGRAMEGMQDRGQSSGSMEQDLVKAYGATMKVLQEREAEASDQRAYERVKAKQGNKASKAKPEGDEHGDDIAQDVRTAYRAHRG